jgi:hypothetical protein
MMLISQSQQALPRRALVAALLFAGALILTGCSVGTLGDHMPAAAGGLPEGTPQRPTTPAPYPAVHDTPPPRSSSVLTDAEQKKLEDDLVAARKRTANPAGAARNP